MGKIGDIEQCNRAVENVVFGRKMGVQNGLSEVKLDT